SSSWRRHCSPRPSSAAWARARPLRPRPDRAPPAEPFPEATLRTLTMTDFHQMEVLDAPRPSPGQGEVLLRVAATGICGSDVHGFTGENGRRHPGQVMGHETAGHVAE